VRRTGIVAVAVSDQVTAYDHDHDHVDVDGAS